MKKLIALVALMAVSCCTSAAHAAAFGSSILSITGAHIEKYDAGTMTWANATSSDITFNPLFQIITSETSAFLEPALTAGSGLLPGFNAPQAFVSPTLVGPAENSFVSFGNPLADSYARGDTNGSGTNLISVGGVNTDAIAEVSSINSLGGTSSGNVLGGGIFTVNVLKAGDYRISFTGTVSLNTTSDGTNFGVATSGYRVQVNGGDLAFINDSNANLNKTISGNASYYYSGLIQSVATTLAVGNAVYSINQLNTASVMVPEPASLAIFGLLGIGALATRRRKA